ncbi:MAG: chemotaxis response regulator protein-glutamate methylesterase [Burkholderiales bacterium]
MPVRVLIVDDSAATRHILQEILGAYDDLKVVGTASDPYMARDKIKELRPDVLTLDIEMPLMSGLDFLERLMRLRPMPVVMVSSLTEKYAETTLRALELGAVDYIAKPRAGTKQLLAEYGEELANKIRAAAETDVSYIESLDKTWLSRAQMQPVGSLRRTQGLDQRVIAIGASTGGTEAIREVLTQFPDSMPPVLIAQHMPEFFTGMFARRLDQSCRLKVSEGRHDEPALVGHAYVAPGHSHMELAKVGSQYRIRLNQGALVNRHRPSVDVLFRSVAKVAAHQALGVILTGMGQDGASGLVTLRETGSHTIAQDEKSSVIFGMPRVAIEKNGAVDVLPLRDIGKRIVAYLNAAPSIAV